MNKAEPIRDPKKIQELKEYLKTWNEKYYCHNEAEIEYSPLPKMKNIWNRDNLILAFNRLVTNPESTYKNYFRDAYSAYGLALSENIALLRKKKSGYLPGKPVRAFFPKANGLTRLYTLLPIEDQIIYQAYGNVIADYLFSNKVVRRRYKKTVFGNLYGGDSSLFFYQKWQNSYSAYTKAVKRAYSDGYPLSYLILL